MTWLGRGEAGRDPGKEPLPGSERLQPLRQSGAPSPSPLSQCTYPGKPSLEARPVPGQGALLPSTHSPPCTHRWATLRKGVMCTAKMLRSSSGVVGGGADGLAASTEGPLSSPSSLPHYRNSQGKAGAFLDCDFVPRGVTFSCFFLVFFFLYFRNTKAIPRTCPFVMTGQKIMPS